MSRVILLSAFGFFFLSACSVLPAIKSDGKVVSLSSNASAEGADKSKTFAAVDKDTSVSPPSTTDLALSKIIVPSGSLSISTSIIAEKAESLSDSSVLSDLGLPPSNVTAVSSGLIVRPETSTTLNGALQIAMELPRTSLRARLLDEIRYVVFYKMQTQDGLSLVSGVIPQEDLKIEDGKVSFSGYFGAYWVAAVVVQIEAKSVKASAPLVNASAVSVIETNGSVVPEETVVSKQFLPTATLSMTVSSDQESFYLTVTNTSPVYTFKVSSCSLYAFDENSTDSATFPMTGDGVRFEIKETLPKNRDHEYLISFTARCVDSNAKIYTISEFKAITLGQNVFPKDDTDIFFPSVDTGTATTPPTSDSGTVVTQNGPSVLEGPGPFSVTMPNVADAKALLPLEANTDAAYTVSATWTVESSPAGAIASVIVPYGFNSQTFSGGVYYTKHLAHFIADTVGQYKVRLTIVGYSGNTVVDFDVNWQKDFPTIIMKDTPLYSNAPNIVLNNQLLAIGTAGATFLWEEVVPSGADYVSSSGGLGFSNPSSLYPTVTAAYNGSFYMRLTMTKDGNTYTVGVINIEYDNVPPVLHSQPEPLYSISSPGMCNIYFPQSAGQFVVDDASAVALRFTQTSGPSGVVTMSSDGINQCVDFAGGNGVYQFNVLAVDRAGNLSAVVPYQIIVDSIAPTPEQRIASVMQEDSLVSGVPQVKFKITLNRPNQDIVSGGIRLVPGQEQCLGGTTLISIPYHLGDFSGPTEDFYTGIVGSTDPMKVCWEDKDAAGNSSGVLEFDTIAMDNTPPSGDIVWMNGVVPPVFTDLSVFPSSSEPSYTISGLTGTNSLTVGYKTKLFKAGVSSDIPECTDAIMAIDTPGSGTLQASYVEPSPSTYNEVNNVISISNSSPSKYYRLCLQMVTGAGTTVTYTVSQWYKP